MTEVLTSSEMRALEQAAINSGRVSGLDLMERAGQGVVDAIFAQWPLLSDASEVGSRPNARASTDGGTDDPGGTGQRRAVVLCGPGNNGGDGFVVARLLRDLGWAVDVYLYGDAARLPADARVNYERFGPSAVRALDDGVFDGFPEAQDRVALLVDAIFGIGLSRPFLALNHTQMSINTCQSIARHNPEWPKVVAIDVPSGMDSDSGRYPGYENENPADCCPMANLTVTFHSLKPGHRMADGPSACGKTVVVDIGL